MYHSSCGRKVFQYIFSSEFDGQSHTLARMIWYHAPTTDKESGLIFFRLSRIVTLDALLNPLIYAVDENDPDKLWILNAFFIV